MKALPLALAERVFLLPWMRRPAWLVAIAGGRPADDELRRDIIILEIREGHLKWAHLVCPKCGNHIELPLAGREQWTLKVDWLRRPTFSPSVWEKATCGAHFVIRGGETHWSREVANLS